MIYWGFRGVDWIVWSMAVRSIVIVVIVWFEVVKWWGFEGDLGRWWSGTRTPEGHEIFFILAQITHRNGFRGVRGV